MSKDKEFLKFISPMSKEDNDNYQKYSKVRSKELYYYLSKFLYWYYDKTKVDYETVSQWIRFDKDVKNVLYRFYATFEEYFKAVILNEVVLDEKNNFIKREESNKRFPNNPVMNTLNVNYQKKFKNKNIPNFFSDKKFSALDLPFNFSEIKRINNLRNKIMHLSFILLPIHDENLNGDNIKKEVSSYLVKTNNQICSLFNNLPSPWNEYLKNELKTTLKYKDRISGKLLNRDLDSKLILDILK